MLVDCRSAGRIQESRDRRVGDLRLLLVAPTSSVSRPRAIGLPVLAQTGHHEGVTGKSVDQ